MVQDYIEGGMRCQDVELFVNALYMRQIGRVVAPFSHRGADLVMGWVNETYSHLRMAKRLLTSTCDFLALPASMPPYWKLALKTLGMLRGLVPVGGQANATQHAHIHLQPWLRSPASTACTRLGLVVRDHQT